MSEDKKVILSKPKQELSAEFGDKGICRASDKMTVSDLRSVLEMIEIVGAPEAKMVLEKALDEVKSSSESRQIKGEFTKKITVKSSSSKRQSCSIV